MPLIPSYIARLRTHSQSTAATSSSQSGSRSNSTAGPSTPGPEFAHISSDPSPLNRIGNKADDELPQVQIARKIHPDLSALLDENAAADKAVEAIGLPPPRRPKRSTGQPAGIRYEGVLKEAEGEDVQETDPQTPAIHDPDTTASPRSPFLSRILSTPILSGVRSKPATAPNTDPESESGGLGTRWSTFGRRHVPPTSQIGEFGSLHRRGSGSGSVQSTSSKPQTQRSPAVTPSSTGTPSQVRTGASVNDTPPSQSQSPAGTVSSSSGSKSYSLHSQSVRSKRHPQMYPEPIPDLESSFARDPQTPAQMSSQSTSVSPIASMSPFLSPKPTRPHLDDSPQTFGRGTPKRHGLTQKTLPEFGDVFHSLVTSMPPHEHQSPLSNREPPWTYPRRSRTKSSESSIISFSSLPTWAFGSESRPRAEDIFRRGSQGKSGSQGERSRLESFVSGRESDSGRRPSADWSAAEAVKTRNSEEGETWPSAVSREMVVLSLGDGARALPVSAGNEDFFEVGEVGTLEGGNKNPTLFGSIGEERRQFLRSARRWMAPRSAEAVVDTSSSTLQQSSSQLPTVTMTSAFDPPASSTKSPVDANQGPVAGGLVPFVSITGPTPTASPRESQIPASADLHPDGSSSNADGNVSLTTFGKRKKDVESEDESQPTESGTRSILLRRRDDSTRNSDAPHAPSSFRHSKRIRLSTPSQSPPYDSQSPHQSPPGSPGAPGSRPPSSLRALPLRSINSRTSSQTSIPLRAIVSPKPPSIDQGSTYHMRDPDLPPPRRLSTQWTGSARKDDAMGRVFPLQGWAFIIGFLVFPLWWVAAAAPVGWGWRRRGIRGQNGKGALSEENLAAREVIEYDVAFTWRRRCRLMSLFGLLVYIPLIVLLVVLVPRP